jgi:integrase
VDDVGPDDFEALRKSLAKTRGPVALKNEVNHCRIVLKFASDQRLIDRPVHFGQSFDRPTAKTLRRARHEAGPRLFEADEVRRTLEGADVHLKAMTLLGLNCGFGNTDVATLPQSALDQAGGWINFPRPKTEIPRRVPLWLETVAALRKAIAERPEPKDPADANLVFLTRTGKRWVRVQSKRNGEQQAGEGNRADGIISLDALSQRFAKLLSDLKINGRRGLGFYTLRHVFETVAGEAKDQIAVNSIMGHVDTSMAGVYRERISDERLRAVTEHVRTWLFDGPTREERQTDLEAASGVEASPAHAEA